MKQFEYRGKMNWFDIKVGEVFAIVNHYYGFEFIVVKINEKEFMIIADSNTEKNFEGSIFNSDHWNKMEQYFFLPRKQQRLFIQ